MSPSSKSDNVVDYFASRENVDPTVCLDKSPLKPIMQTISCPTNLHRPNTKNSQAQSSDLLGQTATSPHNNSRPKNNTPLGPNTAPALLQKHSQHHNKPSKLKRPFRSLKLSHMLKWNHFKQSNNNESSRIKKPDGWKKSKFRKSISQLGLSDSESNLIRIQARHRRAQSQSGGDTCSSFTSDEVQHTIKLGNQIGFNMTNSFDALKEIIDESGAPNEFQ